MNEMINKIATKYSDETILLPQARDYLDIDRQYRELMFPYEAAIAQMEARLNILTREFQFSNDRNPIDDVKSRIKPKESILQKLSKRGFPLTISSMKNNLYDIAGIRVICTFISDVYYIAQMILRQKDVEMLLIKDYIRVPKENGYRSLHLIILVNVSFVGQTKKIPVEIQIRTIAMNFWASTEHQLRYKKERIFTNEMQRQLKHCADLMAEADFRMQQIAGGFKQQW